MRIALAAGSLATLIFVASYVPMISRAFRTRDLSSYSRPSLVLANVGNAVQSVYVFSLPAGPLWFLHGFYLCSSALMLTLYLRRRRTRPAAVSEEVAS